MALTDVYVELKATIADFQAKFAMAAEEIGALEAAQEAASARMAESSVGVGAAMTRQAEETTAATDEIDYSLQRSALAYERMAQAADQAAAQNALAVEKMSADTAALSARFELQAAKATAANEAIDASAAKAEAGVAASTKSTAMNYAMVGVAAGAVAGIAVDMAAKFQESTTRLVTSAGETRDNIEAVRHGILDLAGEVGYTANELSKAMYTVESAGYHGADGLNVLRAAAQGAKMENADLGTVANAVTDILTDYHLPALQAADVTSKLNEAVSLGKTTFQDLSAAMSSVAPVAAATGIPLQDLLGDLAEMTSHGVSADQAAQNLANSIRSLSNPTSVMTDELAQLGIRSDDISRNLGKTGVAGAMEQISTAILQHMGPAGAVMLDTFNKSKIAAEDANKMFQALPPNLQQVANAYKSGGISMNEWRQGLKGLPAEQAALMQQWVTMQNNANGFSRALKSGSTTAQTYTQALAKATGNATSMNVALMLTGENAASTADDISKIAEATDEAGYNVAGWSEVQGNFNTKLSQAKAAAESLAIRIGQMLLPALTAILGVVASVAQFFAKHQEAAVALAAVIGGVLVVALSAAAVAAWSFTAAMLANPVVWIVAAIVAAIALLAVGIYELVAHWQQVKGFFVSLWHTISDAFGHAIDWIKNTVSGWIDDVKAIPGKIGSALSSMGSWIEKTATHAWRSFVDTAKTAGRAVVDFVTNLPYEIGFALGFIAGTLYKAGRDAWHSFQQAVTDAYHDTVDWFKALPGNIQKFFDGVGTWLVREGTDLLTGLWNGIVDAYNAVAKFFHDLPDNIKRFFDGVIDWLRGPGLDLLHGLVNGIVDAARAVWDFFGRLPDDIGNFFSDAGNWLIDAGKNIVIGLANGILSMGSWLWDQVTSFAHGIINGVKAALGIASPSKVMIEMGRWTALGMAQGITDNAHHAMNAAKGLASGIAGAVTGISANARVNVLGGSVGALSVAPSGAYLGASESGQPVQVVINVQGSVHSENSLKRTIQDIFLQHSGRNVTNGLSGVRF